MAKKSDAPNIVLFDDKASWENLLPLTYTRPIADLRLGITTLKEKWQQLLEGDYSYLTREYLRGKYPASLAKENLYISANVIADEETVEAVKALRPLEALTDKSGMVALRGGRRHLSEQGPWKKIKLDKAPQRISMPYDLFTENDKALKEDYKRLTLGRTSRPLSASNRLIGPPTDTHGMPLVFLEEGAVVEGATLNVKNGPIYVGRGAEIMEGSCLRGPVALCEGAVVKMGTMVYGATTLGPFCKVGGELSNVVMMGYSNKAHDGFLGNAVIGEWCNLGAGCEASNLKNDYTEIKLWNYPANRFLRTGLQFCGLIMGDHSKAGINCMFNTATVIGVGVNIHGSGFPRNFVASFSEGSSSGFSDVPLTKFIAIANRVMARRNKQLTDEDTAIFEAIYNMAETYK